MLDPHIKTISAEMEAVQRRAARFCFNHYNRTNSVSLMMQELGCEDIQTRRQQNKAKKMYKIIKNFVEIPA